MSPCHQLWRRSSERVQFKCFFNNTKLNFGPGSYIQGPSELFPSENLLLKQQNNNVFYISSISPNVVVVCLLFVVGGQVEKCLLTAT